jgi:hypothetical protein
MAKRINSIVSFQSVNIIDWEVELEAISKRCGVAIKVSVHESIPRIQFSQTDPSPSVIGNMKYPDDETPLRKRSFALSSVESNPKRQRLQFEEDALSSVASTPDVKASTPSTVNLSRDTPNERRNSAPLILSLTNEKATPEIRGSSLSEAHGGNGIFSESASSKLLSAKSIGLNSSQGQGKENSSR